MINKKREQERIKLRKIENKGVHGAMSLDFVRLTNNKKSQTRKKKMVMTSEVMYGKRNSSSVITLPVINVKN